MSTKGSYRESKDGVFRTAKEVKYIIPISIVIGATFIGVFWAMAFIANGYFQLQQRTIELEKENIKLNSTVRMDKMTFCMQTIMIESAKSGKHIEAKMAKEICKEASN